jgi:hypothetical protein
MNNIIRVLLFIAMCIMAYFAIKYWYKQKEYENE